MRSTFRLLRSTRGNALIEMALALPMLLVFLLGTLDFGRLFRTTMAVSHAVRAGVQYGAMSVGNSNDTSGMQAKATAAASDITGFTPTASRYCTCWNGTTEASMTTCTSTCASTIRIYVQVTGTATFTTFVDYPGVPHSVPVSRTVKMRVQ